MPDTENINFPPDTNPQGGVLNFYCELPHTLDSEEIGFALFELNNAISSMQEPPVARVSSDFVAFDARNELDDIEDYRKFYVEFAEEATEKDIHSAVSIVMGAMRRLSKDD